MGGGRKLKLQPIICASNKWNQSQKLSEKWLRQECKPWFAGQGKPCTPTFQTASQTSKIKSIILNSIKIYSTLKLLTTSAIEMMA